MSNQNMELLISSYDRVIPLKQWLLTLFHGNKIGKSDVNIEGVDNESYERLLTSVYVCEDEPINRNEQAALNFTLSPNLPLQELVLSSIEILLREKGYGKDVLTNGYCLVSADPFAMNCGTHVECRYPNSCVNRLFYREWVLLLSRIGVTAMMFLLQNTSMFYQIERTCFLQISGTPFNNLTEKAKQSSRNKKKVDSNTIDVCKEFDHLKGKLVGDNRKSLYVAENNVNNNQGNKSKGGQTKVNPDSAQTSNPIKAERYVTVAVSKSLENETLEQEDLVADSELKIVSNGRNAAVDVIRAKKDVGCKQEQQFVKQREGMDQYEQKQQYVDICEQDIKQTNETQNVLEQSRVVKQQCKSVCQVEKENHSRCRDIVKVSRHKPGKFRKQLKIVKTRKVTKRGKRRKKFENIGEDRFKALVQKSTAYSECMSKVTSHTNQTMQLPGDINVNLVEYQSEVMAGMKTRKRKLDNTDNENSIVMAGNDKGFDMVKSKRRRLLTDVSSRLHECDKNLQEDGNKFQETVEDINKPKENKIVKVEIEITSDVKKRARNQTSKVSKKKRSPGKTFMSKDKHSDVSFCPFQYQFAIPRNRMLFSRSPRERLPKSALISKLKPSAPDILILYQKIFCETQLSEDEAIRVTAPNLHDVETVFGVERNRQTQQSFGMVEQQVNSSYVNLHPSFWNESKMRKSAADTFVSAVNTATSPSEYTATVKSSVSSDANTTESVTNTTASELKDDLKKMDVNNSSIFIESLRNKPIFLQNFGSQNKRNLSMQSDNGSDGDVGDHHYSKERPIVSEKCVIASPGISKTNRMVREALLAKRKDELILSRRKSLPVYDCMHSCSKGVKVEQSNYGGHLSVRCLPVSWIIRQNRSTLGTSQLLTHNQYQCTSQHASQNQCTSQHVSLLNQCTSQHVPQNQCTSQHVPQNQCTSQHTSQNQCTSQHTSQNQCTSQHTSQNQCTSQHASEDDSTSQSCHHHSRKKLVNIPMFHDALPYLKQLIENHLSCPFRSLLNHHCPVLGKRNTRKVKGLHCWRSGLTISQLLSNHHHHRKVYLFTRACIVNVIPTELFGNRQNLNKFLKNISKIISLGKYDRFTLGQLMNGMKTKSIGWLNGATSNSIKLHVFARLIMWLVEYVLLILKTFFFVTDTGFLRYRLLYYRQLTWNKLQASAIKDLFLRKIFKKVIEKRVVELLNSKSTLGVSVLRFLPKQQSLRPIINLGSTHKIDGIQTQSVNKQLLDLHSILTFLKNQNPSLMGYGKLGTDEIYQAWKSFVLKWRENGCAKMYFVKTDISQCYDSIKQSKLYEIMENILDNEIDEDEYIVRKYFTVTSRNGTHKKRFHRVVKTMSEFKPDFMRFCQDEVKRKGLQNTIFVDKVVYQHENSESIKMLLQQHLFNNLVKVGNHYCLQTSGISQGSVISTLLCSFYYADMEKRLFPLKNDEFLMRIVDDFLYVTSSQANALNFLQSMVQGNQEYNCSTNMEKILTNFTCEVNGAVLPNMENGWFPWCGFLMNTDTLEVCMDFSKYCGYSMKDTMTIELSSSPGKSLKEKIMFSVRHKCHALYIDTTINSKRQALVNLYHQFLLLAFKMHTYIHKLHHKQRANGNAKFFQDVVTVMIQTVQRLVIKCLGEEGKKLLAPINWLGLKACFVKFDCHRSQYRPLLIVLKRQLKYTQKKLEPDDLLLLSDVVEPAMPDCFKGFLS